MTVLKSVPRAVRSKSLFAALSVLLMIAATLFGANVASGDEVWNQSYQRASQSEECVAQPGETPWQDSWGTNPGWSPSWALWANEGQGGWVCNRSITWAQTPVPASSSSGGGGSVAYTCSNAGVRSPGGGACVVGDIGPGGGLVFLISGGLTYEMARKDWGANETDGIQWCSDRTNSVTTGTAVGDGSANTTAMLTSASPFVACTSSASNAARAYPGGGLTDWFLPSQDELNAMWLYSQVVGFNTATYGFASGFYWSSSQFSTNGAWYQNLGVGGQNPALKRTTTLLVRPVRAF